MEKKYIKIKMKDINNFLDKDPFSLGKKDKNYQFRKIFNKITHHHYNKSEKYRKILNFLGYDFSLKNNLENFPYLPIRLFKNFDLISIDKKDIFKTLNSSGTSGSNLSKIYLDKENANLQIKVLNKIINRILGKDRIPMLIIDKKIENQNRSKFNARSAAIRGFSIFGKNHTYLLDGQENIDYKGLIKFIDKFGGRPFFIFGFTSFVYENLVKKLDNKLKKFNFSNGILLHGGGWKKMENLNITNQTFKKKLLKKFKLSSIYNYYGLVEQTGSIFIECPHCNAFVASIFSDVLIRNKNFEIVEDGQKGLVQLCSILPTSYPGHNILTDDIGEILKEKNKKCKLKGKHFLIHGRVKNTEIRGCSDV